VNIDYEHEVSFTSVVLSQKLYSFVEVDSYHKRKEEMEDLKKIFQTLEDIIRGRSYDEFRTVAISKALYGWASDNVADGLMSAEMRSEIFKAGINLHNKLRVLPVSLDEAKAYLKGSSAWILLRFGDLRPTSVGQYVKVFIRASAELENYPPEGTAAALECIGQALASWNEISPAVFERTLTPIDFSELKNDIVNSYLEKLKLLLLPQENNPIAEMRLCASGAGELLPLVPCSIKLAFVRAVANIGHKLSKNFLFDDATYFFSVAVGNLDVIQKSEILEYTKGDSLKLASILLMKIRLNLCLAFVLQEQDLCERAMECVKIAEALTLDPVIISSCSIEPHDLQGCVDFAKFSVSCKSGDWDIASRNIHNMIEKVNDSNVHTLLSAISSFIEATDGRDTVDYLQFYTSLLNKYTDGPNFSLIRVKLLGAMPIFDSDAKMQTALGGKFIMLYFTSFHFTEN
jgi:hypothetical protein